MRTLTRIAVRRPRTVLLVGLLVVAALGAYGAGVREHLNPTELIVAGTPIGNWHELREGRFGEDGALLLRGPEAELDRQGRRFARALAHTPGERVVSPWSQVPGAARLRLRPDVAAFLVDLGPRDRSDATVDRLERLIEEHLEPPMRGWVIGQAPLSRALNEALIDSAEQAELLSLPVLLIVLLLVFRSVVAALVPLLVAGATVLSGAGLLEVVARSEPLDAVALSLASMMGLALGVDYSLLIVSRFREELGRGLSPRAAASLAANTAGRTAAFAGVVLIAIMLVALLLSPGTILLSAAVGTLIVTALGMLGALLITPAGLALLGHRIETGRIGSGRPRRDRIRGVVGMATSRPRATAGLVAAVLVVLALPVLGLETSPPDPRSLPASDRAAQGFAQARAADVGPNVEVALRARRGPITRPDRLRAIHALERRLARLPLARVVSGPGALAERSAQPQDAPDLATSRRRLAELDRGLHRASGGVARLRGVLGRAADGTRRLQAGGEEARGGTRALAAGSRRATGGAAALAAGARQARDGAGRLAGGLDRARDGARRLVAGAQRAGAAARAIARGGGRLAHGLRASVPRLQELAAGLRSGRDGLAGLRTAARRAERELRTAYAGLGQMSAGRVDPQYRRTLVAVATALAAVSGRDPRTGAPVASGYRGLDTDLGLASAEAARAARGSRQAVAGGRRAAAGAERLRDGADALAQGLAALAPGARRLRDGIARLGDGARRGRAGLGRLSRGGARLSDGLRALSDGTSALSSGLGRLAGGQARLRRGVRRVVVRTRPLGRGLSGAAADVGALRGRLDSGALKALARLQRSSPGFFASGYAPLAAIDGAPPLSRAAASYLVAAENGGDTARILVTPDLTANDPRAPRFVASVRRALERIPANTALDTGIGGPTAVLANYDSVTRKRLPWLVAGIVLVTYLLLVPILRSLVLAAVAVGLNLLTVAASFGVLTLLFVGNDPPLGGPGALDVISVATTFAIVFALSIDYQVFLLVRMREAYVGTQRNDAAIAFGVERTARVVSGAALIMVGVFSAFAATGFASLRQFGVGLAFAVAVDATLVRLLLLPALMRWFGLRAWWLPRRLDDRLPALDVEGSDSVADTTVITRRSAEAW